MKNLKVGDYARIILSRTGIIGPVEISWYVCYEGETKEGNERLAKLYPTYNDTNGVVVRIVEEETAEVQYLVEFPEGQRGRWSGNLIFHLSPLEVLALEA